jgi:hypothetical protein
MKYQMKSQNKIICELVNGMIIECRFMSKYKIPCPMRGILWHGLINENECEIKW